MMALSQRRILLSGGYQTHVDAPAEADGAQKHYPPLDRYETEADDGRDRPDLVACNDDGNGFLGGSAQRSWSTKSGEAPYSLDGRHNLLTAPALHQAHEHQEDDCIAQRADGHAINEPFCDCVSLIQPCRAIALAQQCFCSLVSLHGPSLRQILLPNCKPFIGGQSAGKRALEPGLPEKVWRRGQDAEQEEAHEFERVKAE